jgi:hypothetical protein
MANTPHMDRRTINQPRFAYSVANGFLNRHDENDEISARLALDEIQQIRLTQQKAFQSVQIVCHVTDSEGEMFSFGSMTAIGPSSWDSSIETFMPLLIALHKALEPRSDTVDYQEGSGPRTLAGLAAAGSALLMIGGWLFYEFAIVNSEPGGYFLLPVLAAGIWLLSLSFTAASKPYDPGVYRKA